MLLLLTLPASARPQVLVIIADHLTLADVTRSNLPNLVRLRQEGALALMSPGLAHSPDAVVNVYATLGAGDSIREGDVSQGRMAGALHAAGCRTALIGDADGDDTGIYRPASLMVPHPDFTADGTVADLTAPGGKREDPVGLWTATQAALKSCDLVVVHFGDFARAERENERGSLLPKAYATHRLRAEQALDAFLGLMLKDYRGTFYLVVPTPPLLPDGSWDSLTPFIRADLPVSVTHRSVTLGSDTTQTPGLIAARDLAPSLLDALANPVPVQMTGASVHASAGTNLERLDRLTRLNQQVQNPIFWTLGFLGAGIVFLGLGLYLTGRMIGHTQRTARYGLRLLSAWPLALLLAPLLNPATPDAYLAEIVVIMALLALLPTPDVIFSVTALVLVIDGLTGTHLISQSALSEYALSGIRFYGIGNEYMGVLLGGALLLVAKERPHLASPSQGEEETSPSLSFARRGTRGHTFWLPLLTKERAGVRFSVLLLLWFALVTFVLSFPSYGAKAGGAVTAVATFTVAWRLLTGRSVTWKHRLGAIAAGFALILVWAVVGHLIPIRHTHMNSAVDALGNRRFGYIAGIALRKVGLAARVLLHPGTLLGLLAIALMGLAGRFFLARQIKEYLASRPHFAAVWAAGLWGCLVALLFNDSGVVAAILLLACLILSLLHGLFGEEVCGSSPSMSAMSESASPSATP